VQKLSRPVQGHLAFLRNQSVLARHKETLLAVTAGIALLAGLATSANALPFSVHPQAAPQPEAIRPAPARPVKPSGAATAARDKAAAKDKEQADDLGPKAKGVLTIAVAIDKQQLTLYADGRPIAHSRVSTGVPGHPTPTGVFSIIQKDRWHRSNIYGNAPMFYMQRITWSGVAMHQGIVPNQPASHGCIRLPEAFAKQLWGITKLGIRVVVARNEVTPAPFAHARLFTFRPEPPKVEPEPQLESPVSSADVVKAAYGALEVANLVGSKSGATATDAAKPRSPAFDAMAYAIMTPRETPATSSEVVRSVYDGFQPPKVRRMKSAAPSTAVAEVKPLKPGPISVFISRKEGKLFVRKGFDPVFSAPVTFAQPDKPLGTHVYTALSINDDNTTFRWNVMTMPGGAAPAKKSEKGGKVEHVGPASTAGEALDRVAIPQDALDRISELMSTGASLIISDQGLGPETGNGTDFIVLTR
jgi:lipoprotein-anchoring transpeptidase ErfK/SrfK